jgi:type IV pilus assembly protein PilV
MKANFTNRSLLAARHSAGLTLIEVLVTLVITSVGLLGVAALQLSTVRNNYDAYVRSQAAVLASDILDRMRANREAALGSDPSPYVVSFGTPTGTGTRAATDIADWKATLGTQLANGDGAIAVTPIAAPSGPGVAAPRAIVTITVQWGEREAAVPLTFVTSSQI